MANFPQSGRSTIFFFPLTPKRSVFLKLKKNKRVEPKNDCFGQWFSVFFFPKHVDLCGLCLHCYHFKFPGDCFSCNCPSCQWRKKDRQLSNADTCPLFFNDFQMLCFKFLRHICGPLTSHCLKIAGVQGWFI